MDSPTLTSSQIQSFFGDQYYGHHHSYDEHEHEHEHESWLKRMNSNNIDRITNLPDALIGHILSLMHIKDAVRTQLLSKQWRYAWTTSPGLIFSGRGDLQEQELQLVNNALLLHKGPLLNLTLLGIGSTRRGISSPINVWVQCAVDKKIQVLVLDAIDCNEHYYVLPDSLFLCDTLKEFSYTSPKFDLGSSVSWKSLKKLTLDWINNLHGNKIHKIIEGSPVLESLILMGCSGFSRIIVPSGSKLRNLVIVNCNLNRWYSGDELEDENNWDKGCDDLLEITGPSITSLAISGEIGSNQFKLINMSSLVQVSLRFRMSSIFEDYGSSDDAIQKARLTECRSMMMLLLSKVSHVEKLSLGTWCTQILSMCELENLRTTNLKCKILEIDSVYEQSIPGIARLLRSSPSLERLTIYMEYYRYYDKAANLREFEDFYGYGYWKSPERAAFTNPWQNLKVVQIIGEFYTWQMTFMTELAEYVLDHAKVLEEFVLKPTEDVYRHCRNSHDLRYTHFFYVIQKLLSYPRYSHQARVLLS